MAQYDPTNLIALMNADQTDADSGVTQEMMKRFRWFMEQLLMYILGTGETGTSTACTETVLTDSGIGWTASEHVGRTLLITSGDAEGNIYTIDANTTDTLTCTGDTLLSDGMQAGGGDTFAILYTFTSDSSTMPSGHSHDDTNSKFIDVPRQMVIFGSELTSSSTSSLNVASRSWWYKKSDQDTIDWSVYIWTDNASYQTSFDFDVGTTSIATQTSTSTSPDQKTGSLDVSSLAADTWHEIEVRLWIVNALGTASTQGLSFHIT